MDSKYEGVSILVDINTQCLLTIAYRIIPTDETHSHPLQCNADCIESARKALSYIVRANELLSENNLRGWRMFLNL